MKFDTPATKNPIDRLKHIGHATDRIDGRHKVTGTATYAYEWHDSTRDPAYGFVVGAAIAHHVDESHGREGGTRSGCDRHGRKCR
jgi:xanthine dehydrogenase YagR molybdenum-binding subunit